MKLCARTQMLSHYSLNRSLEAAKALGFDGIEISMLDSDFNLRADLLDDNVIQDARELLDDINLFATSVSCHGDFIYSDERYNAVARTIPKVRSYGTEILIISGTSKKTGELAEWDLMIDRTRELVVMAEHNGITLAVEFEPGFIVGTTKELLNLFEDIPSRHLAANLDIGHVFLCDENPLESISMLNDKIVHVHIEDMAEGVHNHLLPGEGDMDLPAYMRALRSIGFNGGMALDLYSCDYEAVSPDAIKYLRALMA